MPTDNAQLAQDIATRYPIRFPNEDVEQNEEWFEYEHEGQWKRLRIHDYDRMFQIPGLYEDLVYTTLKCTSPDRITRMFSQVLEDWPDTPADLRVLDLGAGNGIVAEKLKGMGVGHIVGIDLLPEAAAAAERDRPGLYEQYLATDLCKMSESDSRRLRDAKLNCLCTVAALGFGDIPPRAFAAAMNHVESPGWVAMAIKDSFLTTDDPSGFSQLIRKMMAQGIIEVQAQFRYCHRVSLAGEKLFYVGLIARKLRDIPESILKEIEDANQISSNGRGSELITDTLKRSSS